MDDYNSSLASVLPNGKRLITEYAHYRTDLAAASDHRKIVRQALRSLREASVIAPSPLDEGNARRHVLSA